MIKISKQDIEDAKKLITEGDPEAVGYRVLVYPIKAETGMDGAEKELYPTLAAVDFEKKTDEQKEKESRGSHHGIVVDVGGFAYKSDSVGESPWVELGNVAIFDRYAGVEVELPPGSGEVYRFINDESILGRMRKSK